MAPDKFIAPQDCFRDAVANTTRRNLTASNSDAKWSKNADDKWSKNQLDR